MRKLLILSLLLLGGCTHTPKETDISGIWINQPAINAAAQGQSLRKTFATYGRYLEWNIDTRTGQAQVSSGYEMGEGQLLRKAPSAWTVDYNGYATDELRFDGKHLTLLAREHTLQQVFSRATQTVKTGTKWGNTFRYALNSAYMGGQWKIIDGPGAGNIVIFMAEGRVTGLANAARYELCLDGDCATQGAGNDTLFLTNGELGDTWIFVRNGKQLEILNAINHSRPDEIPQLTPGTRQWLLEKQ
ncbi:hypothetical protein [Pseudomonas sp. 6D_7.1_Bac1]|uniref:hypothetical protein n=1 Tax=Pseudomonas sp. 6D_7.1_Bac1 TaxID=2971615 RepID=UPI0021C81434|nr:hypothetical protein [Pseudomonas sp. 6D_7.1_Bac1]MCU1749375.1 hypothetical protein [Pseudomonas sp. 6D_7.1_Bac1]